MPTSRIVPGRYPPPHTSPIADAIRERRGSRGLTPLDGTLLHVPPVAEGWNALLGAVRTKGKLSGDVRELMILRVAARNHAAFEWIHHEHVGRDHGLTTEQLYTIRDTSRLPDPPSSSSSSSGLFTPLQHAALSFADYSTTSIKVSPSVTTALHTALSTLTSNNDSETQDLLVECAAITSTYNMVSRFLVSLDVAAMSDSSVPWPYTKTTHEIPLPDAKGHYIHAETYITHPDAPWIVCANSLLTNTSMWEWAIPFLLGPQTPTEGSRLSNAKKFLGRYTTYNVLLHDQRGHGKSSHPSTIPASSPFPSTPGSEPEDRDGSIECTIPILASDIALLLETLGIPKAHAIIGVSQGGAAALAFSAMYPHLTHTVVACDTAPKTPAGNKDAWNERIALASGKEGMQKLAEITVPRWFPTGSRCHPIPDKDGGGGGFASEIQNRRPRSESIVSQVTSTTLGGFALGASALQEYDLLSGEKGLLESDVPVLLLAGSLDGAGKVADGLRGLAKDWNARRSERGVKVEVEVEVIEGAGHLPMVDETEKWWEVVGRYLERV